MKLQHSELNEGPAAFERFRKAMKTIVSVPKSAVMDRAKERTKKKKAAHHKG